MMPPERPEGPCSRAYIQGRDITVPCAGIVQATNVLPVVLQASDMLALIRHWSQGNQGVPYELLANMREIISMIDEEG